MTLQLSVAEIDAALPRLQRGLPQYLWLQSQVANSREFHRDAVFRRRYNHFYRVRRGANWQEVFYGLMGRAKTEQLGFGAILNELKNATNRYEASFASKLIATMDPSKPIIDAMVLKNLDLRLPPFTSADRSLGICIVYSKLISLFTAFLNTEMGEHLVNAFNRTYPNSNISRVKMLDLVLWQKRD